MEKETKKKNPYSIPMIILRIFVVGFILLPLLFGLLGMGSTDLKYFLTLCIMVVYTNDLLRKRKKFIAKEEK